MKTKSYIAISVLITFISFTSAECFDKYCWNNSDEMFIAAEQQFIQDLENGLHDHEPTKSNLCEYHLSSIAY